MRIIWEQSEAPGSSIDQTISCLSWMPLGSGFYGYLATGTQNGVVGITLTGDESDAPNPSADGCESSRNSQKRLNYNLRGHRNPVIKRYHLDKAFA